MDIIFIHGLKCQCLIGVWAWEKKVAQTLVLDIDIAADIAAAAASDDLKDAIDYQAISTRVMDYAKENQFDLIETLVARLADLILAEFEVPWVRIRLDKGQAVKGVKHVGVQIERGQRPTG